ncbi:MAG: adenylosuccinate lyase [Chitinivibrionales bacterium]|nr:adenylosuccinate lyase [Chitinivibrionales bacterium]
MTDSVAHSRYDNPLIERYASQPMAYLFSPAFKFSTWRRLWIALAQSQKELGLPITDEQIAQMQAHVDDIDFDMAAEKEEQTRHDVMAHIHTFGHVCPSAKPIIHLGATSAYVGDNTDLIVMREAGYLILKRLTSIMESLARFALSHKELPTLGYTHFQPAQCTTVGKRACLWLQDFMMDFTEIHRFVMNLPLLGAKGTTGTQASFLHLFNNDHAKVKELDRLIAEKMGFLSTIGVSGQTYTRKIDYAIISLLCGLSQSFHKFANDIRLLQHLHELEEPFEKEQVGSSAMAYKRNPMRSERLTSLCRFVLSLSSSPAMTASQQWFERTLDDSANKRLTIPQAFLAIDACCCLTDNIIKGLVVYPAVIQRHVELELPFMATENILMAAVANGGDRQLLHEKIRLHAMAAHQRIRELGCENDLISRISADPAFTLTTAELISFTNASLFTGRSAQQTVEFIQEHCEPIIAIGKKLGPIAQSQLRV